MEDDFELTEEDLGVLREAFYEQAFEIMELLTQEDLSLESGVRRDDAIKNIKRYFHTLKGDSATAGLTSVAQTVHGMEDLMGALGQTGGEFDSEASDLILKVVDEITAAIKKHESGGDDSVSTALKGRIEGFTERVKGGRAREAGDPHDERVEMASVKGKGINFYWVTLTFSPDCKMKGVGVLILEKQLLGAGEVINISPPPDSPEVEGAGEITCIVATELTPELLKIRCLIPGVISEVSLERLSSEDAAIEKKEEAAGGVAVPSSDKERTQTTIRVASEKIDQMMDLVGELVMGRSMMGRLITEFEERYPREELTDRFAFVNEFVEKTLSDLQRNVMGVRMVPVGRVFKRYPRMVRDLSRARGKEIRLVIRGEETEIDKALVDMVWEPLLHILRNVVDHGIESVEERQAAGKPLYGKVRVEAYHQGSDIVIEVEDDGRGIDTARLKEKAIEKGFLTDEEARGMDEREAVALIFQSGFSTAREITDVSGRGIGMDIVKSAVESMRGAIRVKTELGRGTMFTLRFPLTLAIIRAIVFRTAGRLFALPLSSVEEILRVFASDIEWVGKGEVVRYRNKVLPLASLRQMVGMEDTREGKVFVIVISSGESEMGLMVDGLVGDEELVVKAVDKDWMSGEMVSGAAILGDGKVVLILNAYRLATGSHVGGKAKKGAAHAVGLKTV